MIKKNVVGEKSIYSQVLAASPNYLMIEPTNKCNLKCKMCSREELKDIGDMDLELFQKILDTLPEVRTVKFQGLGEAYLANNAIKMLECCKKRGIDVVSITNCLWPKYIDIAYVMSLIKHLYISYHAANEETYKEICGGGNWELLHKNIETMVKNKGECEVIFNCVLSNINYMQAEEIVERAHMMGIETVRFQIMQNWTAEGEELYEDLSQLQEINLDMMVESLKRAYKRAEKLGIYINLVGNDEFDYTHCIWPFERTYINKNGDVLPCHMRPDPRYSVGNIREKKFADIWNGAALTSMREHLSNNIAPEMCKECPYISAAQEIRIIKEKLKK